MWHKCQLLGIGDSPSEKCQCISQRRGGRYSQQRAEMALERCVNVSRVYSTAPKCQLCLTLSAGKNKDSLRLFND